MSWWIVPFLVELVAVSQALTVTSRRGWRYPEWLFEVATTRVEGEPLVIAPARGRAVMIGDHDPAVVASALQRADDTYQNEPHPLSPVAYRRGATGWRCGRLRRPSGTIGRGTGPSGRWRVSSTPSRRATSTGCSRPPKDIFVASVSLAARDDGTLWTWAVRARDVTETLLPEVDVVALHGGEGAEDDLLLVPWDTLLAEAGDHFTEEPGWGLTRWRVTDWPAPTTLARLRARAIQP